MPEATDAKNSMQGNPDGDPGMGEIVSAKVTANQLQLAQELELEFQSDTSSHTVVAAIEHLLDDKTDIECARWFLLSAYRHVSGANWLDPALSGWLLESQYQLAERFIEKDGVVRALRAVLKDKSLRFTLCDFAKTRNVQKRRLSSQTAAFRQAEQLLAGTAAMDSDAVSTPDTIPSSESAGASTVDRRALRRGHTEDELRGFLDTNPADTANAASARRNAMSKEEYSEFEKLMESAEAPVGGQNWSYKTSEERSSLVWGLVSGFAVFALLLWVFS